MLDLRASTNVHWSVLEFFPQEKVQTNPIHLSYTKGTRAMNNTKSFITLSTINWAQIEDDFCWRSGSPMLGVCNLMKKGH